MNISTTFNYSQRLSLTFIRYAVDVYKMTKAVILAGGRNSELSPMTHARPKTLVYVMNQTVIERVLDALPASQIDEVIITTGTLDAKILSAYFKEYQKRKDTHFSGKIKVVAEEKPQGTAGSVKRLERELCDTFIVLQSDVVSSVDIEKMLEFHKKKKAVVTVSLFKVPAAREFGIVALDEASRIVKFIEKPKTDQVFSNLVNAGTYICDPAMFEEVVQHGHSDFSKDVFPRLIHGGKLVYGFEFSGFWIDVGSFRKYKLAHRLLLERNMTFKIPARTKARIIPPVLIGKDCRVGKSVLGPDVCVGDGAIIGDNCKIYDSVIWPGTKIGDGCLIRGSVICENCRIGDDTLIEETILGDKAVVSKGVKLLGNTRVWPGCHARKDSREKELIGAPEDFRL